MQNTVQVVVPGVIGRIGRFAFLLGVLPLLVPLIAIRGGISLQGRKNNSLCPTAGTFSNFIELLKSRDWSNTALCQLLFEGVDQRHLLAGPLKDFITTTYGIWSAHFLTHGSHQFTEDLEVFHDRANLFHPDVNPSGSQIEELSRSSEGVIARIHRFGTLTQVGTGVIERCAESLQEGGITDFIPFFRGLDEI